MNLNIIRMAYHKAKTIIFTFYVKQRLHNCGYGLRVNEYSHIPENVVLGNNVNFNGISIVGRNKIIIGNNFHSGHNCQIIAEIHNYDTGLAIPYDNTFINKEVVIEDNVWIGNNVIILGNAKLGEGCIIQAGAVVISDIPKYAIAGGNPAKVFKYRNIEHYEKMKKECKFF